MLGEFERLLMVAHFTVLRVAAAAERQPELAAKFAVALLRDCGKVPWDKAFMQACITL